MKNFKDLIGKTITSVNRLEAQGYDDQAWVEFHFSDNTSCIIEASFGSYTGNSLDEYPAFIGISNKGCVLDDYGDGKKLTKS